LLVTSDRLKELTPEDAGQDETYQRAREIGSRFQAALDDIFFQPNGTTIPDLTREYGVF
jgi:hypothetical protein